MSIGIKIGLIVATLIISAVVEDVFDRNMDYYAGFAVAYIIWGL